MPPDLREHAHQSLIRLVGVTAARHTPGPPGASDSRPHTWSHQHVPKHCMSRAHTASTQPPCAFTRLRTCRPRSQVCPSCAFLAQSFQFSVSCCNWSCMAKSYCSARPSYVVSLWAFSPTSISSVHWVQGRPRDGGGHRAPRSRRCTAEPWYALREACFLQLAPQVRQTSFGLFGRLSIVVGGRARRPEKEVA